MVGEGRDIMQTIAVIDDDIYIGNVLEKLLVQEGYGVVRAYSGTEALLLLGNCKPDLVLLDLMLPGLSGEEVLPHIKNIPVIVLSAKTDVPLKVKLLLEGASDYITKPFDSGELLARVAVALRKNQVEYNSKVQYKQVTMDVDTHEVFVGNEAVRLTKTEFAILKQLVVNAPNVVTKSRMLELISMDTPDCMESSLKVHISNLRRKMRDAGENFIEAVWGIGFKLN